jgi:hypothetical protein
VRRIFAILAAALMLAACIPVTTKSPVGTTAGFKPDPAIYGMWEGAPEDGKGEAFIAIIPDSDGEATAIFTDVPVPVKSGDWATYAVQTTALGEYRYINARAILSDGRPAEGREATSSFPILYRMTGDNTLKLYLVDEDAAKAAVTAGKIAGKIEGGNFGDVMLTASPAALDAFFSSDAGRALFTKPLVVLHRVK